MGAETLRQWQCSISNTMLEVRRDLHGNSRDRYFNKQTGGWQVPGPHSETMSANNNIASY
jgi:hypothetical protein